MKNLLVKESALRSINIHLKSKAKVFQSWKYRTFVHYAKDRSLISYPAVTLGIVVSTLLAKQRFDHLCESGHWGGLHQ